MKLRILSVILCFAVILTYATTEVPAQEPLTTGSSNEESEWEGPFAAYATESTEENALKAAIGHAHKAFAKQYDPKKYEIDVKKPYILFHNQFNGTWTAMCQFYVRLHQQPHIEP